ncbi:MAG: hypothetical protein QGH33_12310, partial [Pirellulaceae bacterium]|nr:hypothetical protein [Pirellulaceae bacterium]
SRKNVDSHRHVQKTEPQLLFVSSQIHQGQTAKSTGPKPIERNSVNGYKKRRPLGNPNGHPTPQGNSLAKSTNT